MEGIEDTKQLLLISNSTLHGSGTTPKKRFEILSEAGRTPCSFLMQSMTGGRTRRRLKNAYAKMGLSVTSIHDVSTLPRAVSEAEVIFVGGGNTFRLLKGLHDHDLLDPIRQRVAAGVPYIGSSAGSIVAYPTLKTTKDMPVVQPPSFEALGLVPFQISPHYLDPDPASTHMGETQEERIMQFLEENEVPVVGLREGSILLVREGAVVLKGPNSARIFRRGENAVEVFSGSNLRPALGEVVAPTGRVA